MEDCLIAARLAGVSQVRSECPGYGTATFDLKHVQAAERSFIERTASRKEEPMEEQKDARAAARKANRPGRRRAGRRGRRPLRTTRTRSCART